MAVKEPAKAKPKPKRKPKLAVASMVRNKPGAQAAPFNDPSEHAVAYQVTAFAAGVFLPPEISDAVEDEPLFDRSQATAVVKRKRT